MNNRNNLNFNSLPNEIKLVIFSFLTTNELDSLTYVNKNFLFLSNLIWANKTHEDFNCHYPQASNQKFFYRSLSAELAKERKLFAAFQKAQFMQEFINEKFDHYDRYYPFAWIELNRCNFLEESKSAFLKGISEYITQISNKIEGSDLIEFQQVLTKVEKEADTLFDDLISRPAKIPLSELKSRLYDLCKLDAHCALGIILKKNTSVAIDLAELFSNAIETLHLATMQKIIELGLDIHKKIPFRKYNGYFADYDITESWLTFIVMSLDRILFRKISQLPDEEKLTAPCVQKIKSIISFLLESGLDCDEVMGQDENNNPVTLRLYCQDLLENIDEATNQILNDIYKDILLAITSFQSQKAAPRLRG